MAITCLTASLRSKIQESSLLSTPREKLNSRTERITERAKAERIQWVDEIKRALEVAETIPYQYLIQHLGVTGQEFSEYAIDAAFNSLSVQDPNLTTKLEALTTSLLSSVTGNESQLLRLLTWLASNGVDPELNLYGIKTRMQPAILNGVTYWAVTYGRSLSGKMLVAANTLAQRYPGNPSIRTFVGSYGSTLASNVAARDSALKLLDRKALREGMPFGFQEDFRCDTAVFDVFNNSWGVLERVGDGALAEDYAEAIAKRCLGSRYEEQFRMGIESHLSMFGRWSASLRYMSAEQRALVPGGGQGPPDMGPYTRDLERALDAIIRSEKKR